MVPGSILWTSLMWVTKEPMMRLCKRIAVQKQEYGESAQGHIGDQLPV